MTIKQRLWLMTAMALIGLMGVSFFSLQALHTKLIEEKKVQLIKLEDGIFSQLRLYQSHIEKGLLSKEEAQAQAIAFIKGYRYGNGDYFWINDMHPTMIMHPTNPKLDGKDLSANQDKKGNLLFVNMINVIKQAGDQGGFVTYYWNRPDGDVPVEKLSHVRAFTPWGWVVGTGIYIDDIDASFHETLMNVLELIVLTMLVVLVLGMMVTRSLTGAISEIVASVNAVASNMKFSLRLPQRADELGQVSISMNSMLTNIEASISDINTVMSALANGQFNARITNAYVGDLDSIKHHINRSADNITSVMTHLSVAMNALQQGKFSTHVVNDAPGAYGVMLKGVADALSNLNQVVSDINTTMHQLSEGVFDGRVSASAEGDLDEMKHTVNTTMTTLDALTKELVDVAEAQMHGDLTLVSKQQFSGRFKALQAARDASTAKIREAIVLAVTTSQVVNEAAVQVTEGTLDLSSRVQEQASALEETSATIHEMSVAVQANTDNAHKVSALTQQVQRQTHDGVQVMQETITAMQSIKASSNQIADIVTIIDSIAFQTNLLALNAAVEAARAGEHGRGFAVVASEVRALAGKSADAAKDIKTLITDSVKRIDNGTQLADKSGEMLTEITASITSVAEMINAIAVASTEQTEGIQQVNRSVADIDKVTQENAALLEETAAAAETLKAEAEHLSSNMAFFDTGHVQATASKAVATLPASKAHSEA